MRPDLKLLVMSATLGLAPIASFLGGCPAIESEGRLHPVAISYLRQEDRAPIPERVASGVRTILRETAGDVLAFLPGVGEIRRAARELNSVASAENLAVLELYGDLPLEQQQAVLRPGSRRKIVLATNVAETSVTIEGITGVVDSGMARINRLDPALGLDRLEVCRISRPRRISAQGVLGEPGREFACVCGRSKRIGRSRILSSRKSRESVWRAPRLHLLGWGEREIASFPWFEPPPGEPFARAIALLRQLGAVDDQGLTPLGGRMARMPVAPRIARMLCAGNRGDARHMEPIALAAAVMSERDPFESPGTGVRGSPARHWSDSDVLDRVSAMEEFARSGRRQTEFGSLEPYRAKFLLRTRDQLVQAGNEGAEGTAEGELPSSLGGTGRLRLPVAHTTGGATGGTTGGATGGTTGGTTDDTTSGASSLGGTGRLRLPVAHTNSGISSADEAVRRSILAGYADRVAKRRESNSLSAVMVGGRGVRLHERSAVREAALFVCVDLEERGGADALVRQASAIEREWLSADLLSTTIDVEFDAERERVVAYRRTRYIDLVIDEAATGVPSDFDAGPLLASAAAEKLDKNFFQDEVGLNYLARVRSLARWMPELHLPDFGDDPLNGLLVDVCRGCRSLDEVRRALLIPVIQSRLTPSQIQAVAREAPERLAVPSGNRIVISYEAGRPPVLAVRIQELFGLRETPRIAGGRIPVLLHLLAPNMRPQQVTSDLASFWQNTYAEVRKELRRRYPKHSWPDDPTTAAAQRRPGKSSRLSKK